MPVECQESTAGDHLQSYTCGLQYTDWYTLRSRHKTCQGRYHSLILRAFHHAGVQAQHVFHAWLLRYWTQSPLWTPVLRGAYMRTGVVVCGRASCIPRTRLCGALSRWAPHPSLGLRPESFDHHHSIILSAPVAYGQVHGLIAVLFRVMLSRYLAEARKNEKVSISLLEAGGRHAAPAAAAAFPPAAAAHSALTSAGSGHQFPRPYWTSRQQYAC